MFTRVFITSCIATVCVFPAWAGSTLLIEQVEDGKILNESSEPEKPANEAVPNSHKSTQSDVQPPNLAVREPERRNIIINQQILTINKEKINEIKSKTGYNTDKLLNEEKKYQRKIRKKKTKKLEEELGTDN